MSLHNATTYLPSTTQKVAVASSSAAITNAVGTGTNRVRLFSTVDCHVAFSASPTATTNNMPLAAGVPEYFDIVPGHKVAAIRAGSVDGTLYVTELTK